MKRRTSKVRKKRASVKTLQANVMTPRIFWHELRQSLSGLLRCTLYAALAVGAAFGVWRGIEQGVLKNEEFALRELRLNPNAALDEIRLLEVTGIDLHGSLFDCYPAEMEAALEALPEVAGATVTREFPGTLIVNVAPREPEVWVSCADQGVLPRDAARGLLVDREGVAFRCPSGLREVAAGLPVIELRGEEPRLVPGEEVRHPDFERGLRLFRAVEAGLPEARQWIDTIAQYKAWASVLRTHDGLEATFGHEDLERQTGDLLAAVEHAREKGERLASIRLIGNRNLPVRLLESIPPRAIIVEEPVPEDAPTVDDDLRQLLDR